MKSFKQYLTESTKVYEFKIKICGTCPKDCKKQIESALGTYKLESCSAGKSMPIQEHYQDFPEQKNQPMTVFDVCVHYPTTSLMIRDKVSEALGISHGSIAVVSPADEREHAINHAHDHATSTAMIGTDYEPSDNSHLYGEKYVMNFLKELASEKKTGHEIDNINKQLFPTTGMNKTQAQQPIAQKKASHSPVPNRQQYKVAPAMGARQ